MKHRGEILEKAIRKSRVPITSYAKQFGFTQRHMYNLFENADISDEDMLKYGKIIGVDFSKELPELLEYTAFKETQETYHTAVDYQQKYHKLLEEHIEKINELEAFKKKFEKQLKEQNKKKSAAPSATSAPKARQAKKSK